MTDPEHYRAELELNAQADLEAWGQDLKYKRIAQRTEAIAADPEQLGDLIFEVLYSDHPEILNLLLSNVAAASTNEQKDSAFEEVQIWLLRMAAKQAKEELEK